MAYNHFTYVLYWLINSVALYVFALIFPADVTLENSRFYFLEASIYSGFWITFLIWTFLDFANARGLKMKNFIASALFFLVANTFSILLVAKFSDILGLAISSYNWAFYIGVSAYIFQKFAKGLFVGKR